MTDLPGGLVVCDVCGKIRGTTAYGVRSLCLCDGLDCSYCRWGRIRRPISDYLDRDTLRWWHVPHFAVVSPCGACRRLAREAGYDIWGSEVRSDPAVMDVIDAVRAAEPPWSGLSAPIRDAVAERLVMRGESLPDES